MNRATRITVAALGIVLALSGISHGFFETLQGSVPTGGLVINAIDEAHRMWPHGSEPAFTVVPNVLVTGVLAIITGLAIIAWSVGFLQRRRGPLVFLLLFILLFLVGGGIGQVFFFTLAWAAATRIHRPLAGWQRALPPGLRRTLAGAWPGLVVVGPLLLLFALVVATTGFVPGVSDPDRALAIMLAALASSFILLILAFVAGFAHDIEARNADA